jgi:hypothetical protein
MVHSITGENGFFAHLISLAPGYSEILVVILILVLLSISFDEIMGFVVLIRETFVYPAPHVCP